MSAFQESVSKPLTPFIIAFGLVIILTLLVANINRKASDSSEDKTNRNGNYGPKMELSPFSPDSFHEMGKTDDVSQKTGIQYVPNIKKLIMEAETDFDSAAFDSAEDKLRTALVFSPDNIHALSLLGKLLYIQEKFKEAEFIFRRISELTPDDSSAYNNLGAVLAKQKRFREAISATRKSLELEPDSPVAELNLAGMHAVNGDTSEAILYFKRAYEKLGEKILPLSENPNFDSLRNKKEFYEILLKVKKNSKNAGKKDVSK